MTNSPVNKPFLLVGWLVVVVFGIPGIFDLVTGALDHHPALALYGLGWVMIAAVFVSYALPSPALHTSRARVARLLLGYAGLALAIWGFVTK